MCCLASFPSENTESKTIKLIYELASWYHLYRTRTFAAKTFDGNRSNVSLRYNEKGSISSFKYKLDINYHFHLPNSTKLFFLILSPLFLSFCTLSVLHLLLFLLVLLLQSSSFYLLSHSFLSLTLTIQLNFLLVPPSPNLFLPYSPSIHLSAMIALFSSHSTFLSHFVSLSALELPDFQLLRHFIIVSTVANDKWKIKQQ